MIRERAERARFAVGCATIGLLLASSASACAGGPAANTGRFTVSGTQVHGTPELDGAPVLTAGRYVDDAPDATQSRHYVVRRKMPGSTVFVGFAARPEGPSRDDRIHLGLWTVSGTPCGSARNVDYDEGTQNSLVALGVSTIPLQSSQAAACRDATELHLVVEPAYGSSTLADAPAELVVLEEPGDLAGGAGTLETLPAAARNSAPWGSPMPVSSRTRVTGGHSLAGSRALAAGSYASTIRPGDLAIFHVRLRWGQRLRAEVRVPRPSRTLAKQLDSGQTMDLRVLAPDLSEGGVAYDDLPVPPSAALRRDGETRLTQMSYDVRYRNREETTRPNVASSSLAGDYYVMVDLAADADPAARYTVPYTLDLSVDDTTDGGAPAYEGGTKVAGPALLPATPPEAPGPDVRGIVLTVLTSVGIGLVVLGAAALLFLRLGVVRARPADASG